MLKITALDKVLFDPVSYFHHTWFHLPARFNRPSSKSIWNDLLIEQYELEVKRPVIKNTSVAEKWLTHWFYLPQIAFIMACQRHRTILLKKGMLLRLPLWVQQFAKLEMVEALPYQFNQKMNFLQLLAYGAKELSLWEKELPGAISQRMPFLFPFSMNAVLDFDRKISPNLLFINLAIQHVKKNPQSLAFIGA
ncbi:type III secretion apparatus protein OrgA/MxiK [Candidatus Hamiltonella defensa]|uniref:Oxidoreductase n=3 Tax=Candidatus Williamhamiltonella defendens TaxID=138072 RepID=A0A2D3TDI2_9ENTR|nr:type III secretion apparatus protein OrgA/MxiK [Candidatus Hamiltonella defensa]ACQ67874.1 oxygen-regulated invasion protein [Candidatus Hamiltonella defensa 5AT (Acyrthosiphon pisum)]ASV33437.1 type III secretion apparatus protein OrgA/MxiK [Candidatus Hamiltonella defensa]ATW22520.1 oxidoreductase [Candidatus Hamiltonella defensa]ATW33581.1 oxidoreductase [Candidatus Hamiltonella defensa]AWK16384.1 oxidoreductase [Candidatus Hamiltonella defensa]